MWPAKQLCSVSRGSGREPSDSTKSCCVSQRKKVSLLITNPVTFLFSRVCYYTMSTLLPQLQKETMGLFVLIIITIFEYKRWSTQEGGKNSSC